MYIINKILLFKTWLKKQKQKKIPLFQILKKKLVGILLLLLLLLLLIL